MDELKEVYPIKHYFCRRPLAGGFLDVQPADELPRAIGRGLPDLGRRDLPVRADAFIDEASGTRSGPCRWRSSTAGMIRS